VGLAAGQIALDTDFTGISQASNAKPAGRLVQTVAQAGFANNTLTPLTFTTEDLDTHNFHNNVTNNSRVTPTVPGWYRVFAAASLVGNTDFTAVEVTIRANGGFSTAPAFRIQPGTTAGTIVIQCSALILCNGTTDYFEGITRTLRSGSGTGSTAISIQFASVLEWTFERDQ
jgi:hypothetical protein